MVTLKDVAKEAGVSINTVSCALRGSPKVNIKSMQRIKKIAESMGYTPNAAARTLRLKKTKVIGVIVSDISNPVFGKMVKGIESAIKQKDYSILIGNTDEDYAMEEQAVSSMISKGVDGVIITPTQQGTSSLEMLDRAGIPFILMGRKFQDYATHYVVCDDLQGGFIAGEHFVKKGHSKMLVINGSQHISSAREREMGFVKALNKHKLSPMQIYHIIPDIYEGYRLMTAILQVTRDFTAVFCFDDYTAFGVIKAINEQGIRVPEEIAVIGYDNTEFAEMLGMGLSSVDFNQYRIGELAAEQIIGIIQQTKSGKPDGAVKQVILEPSLVVRGST